MIWVAISLLVGLAYVSFRVPERKNDMNFDWTVKLVAGGVVALGASSAWLKFVGPRNLDLVG